MRGQIVAFQKQNIKELVNQLHMWAVKANLTLNWNWEDGISKQGQNTKQDKYVW